MSPEPWTKNEDDIQEDEFCIEDNLGLIVDQNLGGEQLTKFNLEEGNVFDNDLP